MRIVLFKIKFKEIATCLILIVASSYYSFCQNNSTGPESIKVGIGYFKPDDSRLGSILPICAYLQSKTGYHITPVSVRTTEVMEAMNQNEIDVAFLIAFDYVIATTEKECNVEPLVIPSENNAPSSYNSCIISNPKSGIKNMGQFLKKSKSHAIYFVSATSTSGHLIPRLYLMNNGFKQAENHFKSIEFAGNHFNVLEKVKSGEAMLGALAYSVIESETEEKKLKPGQINVLWVSEKIVEGPICIRKDLPSDIKQAFKKAFLELHTDDPYMWQHIQKSWLGARLADRYMECKDEDFQSIRNQVQSIEDLQFLISFYIE